MPSQEEYLDNLLKDVMNGEQASENGTSDGVHVNFFNGLPAEYDDPATLGESAAATTPSASEIAAAENAFVSLPENAPDFEISARKDRYEVQDTADMAPEEIERILAENAGKSQEENRADRRNVDLETLLQEAEEANLKDINDMLRKADRNEPVDEGIIALLEQAQQQNAEIEWKDIEEQRYSSQPEGKNGLRKIFGRLFKRKKRAKGGERLKGMEPPENPVQQGSDAEESEGRGAVGDGAGKEPPLKKADENRADQEGIAAGKKDSANLAMDDLFGAMEAIGAEETVRDTTADGLAEDTFTDSAWPEFQGLSLGFQQEDPAAVLGDSEEAEAQMRDRDAVPADPLDSSVIQGAAVPDDLLEALGASEAAALFENTDSSDPADDPDAFGMSDGLDILGEMEALSGEETEGERKSETKQKAEKQEKRGRQKKSQKEKEPSAQKGLLGRILDFLTQEDPEDEEEQQLILSDENEAILKELNEENAKKKKKKAKKKKNADREEDQMDREDEEDSGARKAKKKAKQKKVREPKQREPEEPVKRLSARRVSLIFLICATVVAAVLILSNVVVDFADKKKAAAAFYEGDYEACYQNLVGKHLNESQQVMYGKSESILRMRLWMREYEMFVQSGLEPEALDSLMQSVYEYPALYQYSSQWNAAGEVQEIYGQMLGILQSKYGLTEEMAETIAGEQDDFLYSKMVRTIAGGGIYGEWDGALETQDPSKEDGEKLEDLLPEEEELEEEVFASDTAE